MNNIKIHDIDVVIFDTETTGLDPDCGDRIIEIAGVRMKGDKQVGFFESFINPEGKAVSEAAYRVNHISQDMLENAPLACEVLPKFMEFSKGAFFASYNTRFDLKFLSSELKRIRLQLPRDLCAVDILTMARRMIPALGSYSLEHVVFSLGIASSQAHRAMQDVHLAAGVFEKIKHILKAKQIDDMNAVVSLFAASSQAACCLKEEIYGNIEKAISRKSRVSIKYISRINGEITRRIIEPLEITQDQYKRYLVGFCCLRRERRTFSIDGILHIENAE